jgi:hypothetical protein
MKWITRSLPFALIWVVSFFVINSALAIEIEVQGEGRTEITQDIASVQYNAKKEAIRNAVTMAIHRLLGPEAMKDPKVQQKFEEVLSQINVFKVKQNDTARKEGNLYIINTVLTFDETKFRQLLSDMGIALGTQAVRSSAIITLMDEFFTTPSDLQTPAPLTDITIYKYDRDTKYKAGETVSARQHEEESVGLKSQSAGSLAAKGKESASYSGQGSLAARSNEKSSLNAASLKKNTLNYGSFVNASDNEHEFFTNIKTYQPKNSLPDKQNFTIKAIQSAYQTYDLRILDNDQFRSKYFKDRAITIDKLENSADLAKYIKFSRDEAKADFFSVGSSIIVERGKDPSIDKFVCDGMVALKVYSTLDSEAIASGALTESASGNSPDQCRANVAKKIGENLGFVISSKIQDYWKKRQMYGMEYVVILTGNFTPMTRIQFTNTIKNTQGVTNVKPRTAEPGKYEFILSYNGNDPLADALFAQIAASPLAASFSDYDYTVDGNQVKFYPVSSIKPKENKKK